MALPVVSRPPPAPGKDYRIRPLKRGDKELSAGRLGKIEVVDDEIRLGAPFIFNKDNIDRFNF